MSRIQEETHQREEGRWGRWNVRTVKPRRMKLREKKWRNKSICHLFLSSFHLLLISPPHFSFSASLHSHHAIVQWLFVLSSLSFVSFLLLWVWLKSVCVFWRFRTELGVFPHQSELQFFADSSLQNQTNLCATMLPPVGDRTYSHWWIQFILQIFVVDDFIKLWYAYKCARVNKILLTFLFYFKLHTTRLFSQL